LTPFLLPRACSTMDKIVDRYALTIYPYSLTDFFIYISPVTNFNDPYR
jgi:hypothetical protein